MFLHIPNPAICLYLSYQEVQVALPRQFSVFHFLHLCWNCNCYQWWLSLLQVMNINVKPQSSKTWSYQLLRDCFNSSFSNWAKSPAILFSAFLILQEDWKGTAFSLFLPLLITSTVLQILNVWHPIAGTPYWAALKESFPHKNLFSKFCGKLFINSPCIAKYVTGRIS